VGAVAEEAVVEEAVEEEAVEVVAAVADKKERGNNHHVGSCVLLRN
jgi:hypothetical protein